MLKINVAVKVAVNTLAEILAADSNASRSSSSKLDS
jgi:hypothetical protein